MWQDNWKPFTPTPGPQGEAGPKDHREPREENTRRKEKRRKKRTAKMKKAKIPIVTWNRDRSIYERTEPIETEEHHRLHRQTEMGNHNDKRDQSGQDGGNLDRFGGRDHRSTPVPQKWHYSPRLPWTNGPEGTKNGLQGKSHRQPGRKSHLIAVYQPVSTHGETAIEINRNDIEELLDKVPRENMLLIGGDHSSQIA